MSIVKPDPYLSHYIYEKETNPNSQIVLRQYERRIVERIDAIVELAHGERDIISTASDWKVFEELLKFFASEWPDEFNEFQSTMKDIREIKGEGYSRSREIKHVGSFPPKLMRITKAIFPSQQWDKKFTSKLVRRFPLFRVGTE